MRRLFAAILSALLTTGFLCAWIGAEESSYVIDIDPGEYASTMTVGETQLLSPTAIYNDSVGYTDSVFSYASSDHNVATVNALGRVSALSEGDVTIYVTCDAVTISLDLTVQLVYITEIDLGEYQKTMAPGESQVLSPTAIYNVPDHPSDSVFTYESDDEDVAAINALGRITAISEGKTTIRVSCGDFTASFRLRVQTDDVVDLDLGDYQQSMVVGTSQMLSPTAIYDNPETTQNPVYSYETSNDLIAEVNALGRITAVSPGSVRISVSCEGLTEYADITVKANEVTDLDIDDHEDELETGKTMTLTVTMIPSDLQNKKITYRSSNEQIATVNDNGRVTGVAPGAVTITISCDNVTKTVKLTVKNKTDGITVTKPYVVLKPEDTHTITASVEPDTAPQALTYRSLDTAVATVSETGIITAVSPGSTSILISNSDQEAVVTVIVNENAQAPERDTPEDPAVSDSSDASLQLTEDILSGEDSKTFYTYQEDLPIIPTEVLLALYGTEKSLTVDCHDYNLTICGRDIKNAENEVDCTILFSSTSEGLQFTLNNGENLPGSISLALDTASKYRHLYLFNPTRDQWQLLNSFDGSTMSLDTPARYMLTTQELSLSTWDWWAIGIGVIIVIGLCGSYIFVKKRHWFW